MPKSAAQQATTSSIKVSHKSTEVVGLNVAPEKNVRVLTATTLLHQAKKMNHLLK